MLRYIACDVETVEKQKSAPASPEPYACTGAQRSFPNSREPNSSSVHGTRNSDVSADLQQLFHSLDVAALLKRSARADAYSADKTKLVQDLEMHMAYCTVTPHGKGL